MGHYIKIDNEWKNIVAVYKKVNGHWTIQSQYDFDDTLYIYDPATVDVDIFLIVAEDSYTGKQFYLIAKYNTTRVYPSWSITSGNQYATINSNGRVTILQGVTDSIITVQATYGNLVQTKAISISYDNQLTIEGPTSIIGESGNVVALYNNTVVNPTWTITSGGEYASIDSSGVITILNSGVITVCAEYGDYSATKTITLTYSVNGSSQTEVDPDTGAIITTETTTTTDPETGATTETTSSTTTNQDGSTSESTTETTTNQDGSTTTTNSTTNSDGSSSESIYSTSSPDSDGAITTTESTTTTNADGTSTESSSTTVENEDGSSSSSSSTVNYDANGNQTSSTESTTTVSAADSDGTITTETNTATTNEDGSSSESTTTLIENEDGSSSSQSQTINYDENGDTTGSTTNTTDVNADGSSQSQTTNYDENGDPTDQQNVGTDTTGNVNTQDITYDENGDATVTGYDINTDASNGEGKDLTGDGVNTEFVPFDDQGNGFICHIKFKSRYQDQPIPPLVADTDDSGSNYLYNVLCAKDPNKNAAGAWPGFDIRWTLKKSNGQPASGSGLQFRYTDTSSTSTKSTAMNGKTEDGSASGDIFDLTIAYDPNLALPGATKTFNVTSANGCMSTISTNSRFSTNNIEFTIGYMIGAAGVAIRHSNVTIYEFTITKI